MKYLGQYLMCKKCGAIDLRVNSKTAQCLFCRGVYEIKKGVVYTTESTPSVGSKYARQEARNNWSKWRESNYEFLKEKLHNFSDRSIVADLGCGESPFGDLLERFRICLKVDFTSYAGVNIVANLNEKLPIKPDSMDIIVTSNTLEHLPDTDGFLTECSRILKPGGSILITVPFMIPLHQEPFDFLRFTEYQLKFLLEKIQFVDIEIKPLSNFFEIYQSTQSAFLNAAVNQQKSILPKAVLRLYRKIQFLMMKPMSSFFEKVKDRQYPKGYAILARKKSE